MTSSQAFRHFTTKKALRHVLTSDIPSSQGVGLDGIHPSSVDGWSRHQLEALVTLVGDSVRSGDHRFTSYREGLASRGRDRTPRVFSIPTIRDRLALNVLKNTYAFTFGISGPEPPQRKISRVVDSVQSGAYTHYLKVDIQDFFGSIRHETLLTLLERKVRKVELLRLTDRALRNSTVAFGERSKGLRSLPDGVPLGLPISSQLAELYLAGLDDRVGKSRSYFRYVDDIVVLSSGPPDSFELINNTLNRIGLTTHPIGTPGKCETGLIADGFDYLGYTITSESVRVAMAGMKKIESQLARTISQMGRLSRGAHHSGELGRLVWRLNLLIGGCVIDGRARGWIRYYNRATDLTSLGHLDALVQDLLARYGLTGKIEVKTFGSAYWASRDNDRFRSYTLDLDTASPAEARTHLHDHESWTRSAVSALSDEDALAAYRRLVRRHVADLEHDLEPAS